MMSVLFDDKVEQLLSRRLKTVSHHVKAVNVAIDFCWAPGFVIVGNEKADASAKM